MDEENKELLEKTMQEPEPLPDTGAAAETGVPMQEKSFCVNCGAELQKGQRFCPQCGQKIGENPEPPKPARKKGRVIGIVIGILTAAAIVIAALLVVRGPQIQSVTLNKDSAEVKAGETITLSFTIDPEDVKDQQVTWESSNESIAVVKDGVISGKNEGSCTITVAAANGKTDTCNIYVLPSGPDFESIYNEYCQSYFADLASDGSYLSVDTNVYDIDDHFDRAAYNAIAAINEALGLPESVLNQMNQTRSLDGMQKFTNDEIEITWTYHPNKGLKVNYALK